jgi:hypothetical protein
MAEKRVVGSVSDKDRALHRTIWKELRSLREGVKRTGQVKEETRRAASSRSAGRKKK